MLRWDLFTERSLDRADRYRLAFFGQSFLARAADFRPWFIPRNLEITQERIECLSDDVADVAIPLRTVLL
jgi:hypothetical protein